jgi:hypothetical protein
MVQATCPRCGAQISVRARAPLGAGTQRKIKRLNESKKAILEVLQENVGKKFTVREVQSKLAVKKAMRNYHQVQADLSLLVGNNYVQMSQDSAEVFDGQRWHSKPVPKYWVD